MASRHPRASRILGLSAVVAALVALSPIAASAQDCKPEVSASSEPSTSRTLGAFPGSLFAWKAKAKADAGPAYDTWLRAQAKRIDCKQAAGKWICTRTAKPCATGSGGGGTPGVKLPPFADDKTLELIGPPRMKGEQITLLQQYLIAHGATITADGSFGPATKSAVEAYQRAEGLTDDGKVGPATKKRLMETT